LTQESVDTREWVDKREIETQRSSCVSKDKGRRTRERVIVCVCVCERERERKSKSKVTIIITHSKDTRES